jgi:hypothetical protein
MPRFIKKPYPPRRIRVTVNLGLFSANRRFGLRLYYSNSHDPHTHRIGLERHLRLPQLRH